MSQLIESMESRTLLSASATTIAQDIANLKAARGQVAFVLTFARSVLGPEIKALKSAIVGARPTAAERKSLATFVTHGFIAQAKYRHAIATLLTADTVDSNNLARLVKMLNAHPSSTIIEAKVETALTKLQNAFSAAAVTALETNANATVTSTDADLDAIAAAIPPAQAAVTTTEMGIATSLPLLSFELNNMQSAITTLATDVG